MRFAVAGLGSMGTRRIRCLKKMGHEIVAGIDSRADRRDRAVSEYQVPVYGSIGEVTTPAAWDALIISVPPDQHAGYISWAVARNINFFVEASVVDDGLAKVVALLRRRSLVAAPSATLLFHPAIQLIQKIVAAGELGRISNILYHSGQYLPDWHIYERVSDYYVSNPATGGGREIVPFELSWMIPVFGWPHRVAATFRKTIEIEGAVTINDTYNCLLDYRTHLAVLTVDVVSRCATRRLVINGDRQQLRWDWDGDCVDVYDPVARVWNHRAYERGNAQTGYCANIAEQMYIDEMEAFVAALRGEKPFVNSLANDLAILRLLYSFEKSDRSGRFVKVKQST